ncbi:helix-turn-helix domain-containing protein [Streptomyces silvisoli]|uniref:Helix-turn-helix transcriptional regulator n=1 Tax=Streptomyces silvisoli TaxID=3034235 RepID=A0ABT5ZU18_9ACTN|nr:helix-turn-helix transcriptional regulator [Streptomyces silvisoli]MDF3293330.1 helix-turn-helix transcriptional regulator [Streptomyces silvisoli]
MATELEVDLDSASSMLTFYGAEQRRIRTEAKMSQARLAKLVFCTPSLLCKIEAAQRVPSEELAVATDAALNTGGHFARLWPLVIKYAYPAWFRPFVELEEQATAIRSFENRVVPGLLQTEEYARALFAGGRPDKVEELVAARLNRQRVLTGDAPPRLWAIMDENALRANFGGPSVMHAQLARLLQASEIPRIVVQVVPANVRTHAAYHPFACLSFTEGSDVLYVDGFCQGELRGEPATLATAHHTYDLLRAIALSPDSSIDLIVKIMKDLK